MDAREVNGKRRRAARQSGPTPSAAELAVEGRRELHTLSNTLASLRLRVGILADDPICVASQGENLSALMAIADDALHVVRRLQPAMEEIQTLTAPPRRTRRAGRG